MRDPKGQDGYVCHQWGRTGLGVNLLLSQQETPRSLYLLDRFL